jgi:hypothetical protein
MPVSYQTEHIIVDALLYWGGEGCPHNKVVLIWHDRGKPKRIATLTETQAGSLQGVEINQIDVRLLDGAVRAGAVVIAGRFAEILFSRVKR